MMWVKLRDLQEKPLESLQESEQILQRARKTEVILHRLLLQKDLDIEKIMTVADYKEKFSIAFGNAAMNNMDVFFESEDTK